MKAGSIRWMLSSVPALLVRPHLWGTALRQARRLARPGWWRRPPFLPMPDGDYLHFRMVTMYGGDGDGPMPSTDLIEYLEWCRRWPAMAA